MTAIAHQPHRVSSALAGVRATLSAVVDVPLWSMPGDEVASTLGEVQAAKAQLADLEAQLLLRAEQADLPGQTGATSTANWLAHSTQTTRAAAHRTVRLAKGLDAHEPTRTALAAGALHVEQAEIIVRAVDELPDGLDPGLIEDAERHLLAEADRFDAKTLRTIGRRLLEVIAPDQADAHEAKLLEAEEADAQAATKLTMWDDGHGRVHGRFTIDALTGAMLKKALLAFAAPRHQAASGPLGERRPTPKRLGRAFAELIQRYPTKKLPKAGGVNATVVVMLDHDSLVSGLQAAQLDTGERISAVQARRLACEAGIVPAVLGGKSQVLDLGREARFHNPAQRLAAALEQRTCAAEGCDWPAGMCHMHHPLEWSRGGRTDRDGILLCPGHHARAHDPAYTMTKRPAGKYTFTKRC